VSGRVDEVDHEALHGAHLAVVAVRAQLEAEADGAALHSDAALLLVVARVEVAQLARLARRDDAVGGEERVGVRRLAVVDMADERGAAHIGAAECLAAGHAGEGVGGLAANEAARRSAEWRC
jgi:hypothetical protein